MGHLSGWDRQGGVPCLRRASFAEVATKAESGYAQAGRHFAVLTYFVYAPRVKMAVALLDDFFEHSRWLLISALLRTFLSYLNEIFNRPNDWIR
jgi:hypothetical protein